MHKKSQVQKRYREFSWIFTVQHRKLFQDSNNPIEKEGVYTSYSNKIYQSNK
jgi:hypothetical protein